MNILYLCADRGIPIRGHKGAAVHVRALSDAIVNAGHNVTILTPRPGPSDGPAPLAPILECPMPPLPDAVGDDAHPLSRQSQAYVHTLTAAALDWLAQNPADAIYERYSLWSDVGARLRVATHLPFILEVNAPLRQEAAQHRGLENEALAAQIEAAQFRAADFVAVVSEELAAYVAAHGADPAKVHVLPNGVDPQHFHPAVRGHDVRRRYGLKGRIIVGFAGRMRPWHDGLTLLRAFARLHATNPAYHLLLVGDMSPQFMEAVAAAGLEGAVTCTGPVPHADVPAHLAAMKVAVSSHAPAADDAFYFSPLKLMEYLACAVPTVAAAIGQPGRLIQPGYNGYLYPPGDDAALAAAIRALVKNPAEARQMAWNGATLALQNYTWAQTAAYLLRWLGAKLPETTAPALPILDPKLRRRLYRATRADLVAPLLPRGLPNFSKRGDSRLEGIQQIEVLKYKPGRRCVLAYTLLGRQRRTGQLFEQRVIGKAFRDERGIRLFRLQELLWRNGFGPDAADGISVPQPLAYVPKLRLLVQASAPGKTLNALSRHGSIRQQVARSAEGLARLHATQAFAAEKGLLKPYTLADELRGLENYTAQLAQLRPADLPVVRELQAALQLWAQQLPETETITPVHRDFYHSQVLLDGLRLHLIDFDLLALGDPALDVANFMAHLAFLGLEQFDDLRYFVREMDDFINAYTNVGAVDGTFAERVAFYQAATFFRLLSVIAPRPSISHLFEPLLAHTQAAVWQPA